MSFSLDFILDITFLLGAVQSLLLGLMILIYKRKMLKSNIYLALFLFIFSAILLGSTVQRHIAWWYGIFFDPLVLLIGPVLYLYIKSFTSSISLKRLGIHIAVLIIYLPLICWFVFVVLQDLGIETTIEEVTLSKYGSHPAIYALAFFKLLHLIFYAFLSFKEQAIHRAKVENYFSEVSEINLQWVKQLISAFIFLVIITSFSWSLQMITPEYTLIISGINLALITPLIYFAAFKGLKQPLVFDGIVLATKSLKQKSNNPNSSTDKYLEAYDKYSNTRIPDSLAEKIAIDLVDLMETRRMFLHNEISMNNLAESTGYSIHMISQVLNDKIGKSFYEFVNEYRINEAKRLIQDNSYNHFTLLAIGMKAGFNSKTSFNTVFKKYTGSTPSQFKKEVNGKPDLVIS